MPAMPLPLVFAGLWLATLIGWVACLAYDTHLDNRVRKHIATLGDGEPPPKPTIDPPDEYTELDREWCSTMGLIL